MATSKGRRIGILIITGVMIVGTLGSFLVMVLSSQNDAVTAQQQQDAYAQYQADSAAYQTKLDEQAVTLSAQYYPTFSQYAGEVAAFDMNAVGDGVETKDLLVGTGATIDDATVFSAYYIGWNPEGTIFDQSIENDALKSPLAISGLANAGLIQGWKDGIIGMNIGGVREITIPSDLAYGESGSGDDIPPNTPIKFVVMAIEQPETIPAPQVPSILLQ